MTLGDKLYKILIYGGSWKTILGGLRVTIQILFLALVPRPDFIILDPPRDGIHPKVLKKIIDYGVDKLIYVAFKPTSLAREVTSLQGRRLQG